MKKSLFTLLAMMLLGTAIAQPTSSYYQTLFDESVYEDYFAIVAAVSINGEIQSNPYLELGAWDETHSQYVGGILGVQMDAYPAGLEYGGRIFGYPAPSSASDPAQSIISFRLYDHSIGDAGEELDLTCDYRLTWTAGAGGLPSTPIVLEFYAKKDMVFEALQDNNWSNAANWTANGELAGRIPAASEDVTIAAPCTLDMNAEAASITVESSLTIGSGDEEAYTLVGALTIKDGGQFFAPSGSTYTATVEKEILGYGDTKYKNYYFLSIPVSDFNISTGFEAAGMLEGDDYDLYFFSQNDIYVGEVDPDNEDTWWSGEWQNYRFYTPDNGYENGFTDDYLITGQYSYLYAKSEGTTLSFNGQLYSGNGQYSLRKNANSEWPGFQMVGNPFPCNTTVTRGQNVPGCYIMKQNGRNEVIVEDNPIVAPAAALMFYCSNAAGNAAYRRVTFTPTTEEANVRSIGEPRINIEVMNNGELEDRAYVRMYESEDLVKFSLRNDGTKIFIPQNGKKYAAVYAGEAKTMPLCFTSTEGGIHTISVKLEDMDCSYLHLIDNVTGADIDLLRTPKYSFDANAGNYATRFKLVFDEQATNEIAENFAFISNGELMINNSGNATLQVMDITGRILSTENIQNCYSKSLNLSAGVYVVRLTNGNDVKAQKIVVE